VEIQEDRSRLGLADLGLINVQLYGSSGRP
jgi:hypothetical protein